MRGPKRLGWTFGVGVIFTLALLLPIGAPAGPIYIYVKGYDWGVWENQRDFRDLTLVLPSSTHDPPGVLTGRLDRLSANFWSASASVDESKLFTWGVANRTGQGNQSLGITGVALVRDFSPAKIVSLDSGDTFSMVLLDNGTLYSWGTNTRRDSPLPLVPCTSCFLGRSDGRLDSFELEEVNRSSLLSGEKIVKVVANSLHTILLTNMGNVYAYGSNLYLGLGQSDNTDYWVNIPTLMNTSMAVPAKVVDISSHLRLTYLHLDDGSFMCYGESKAWCTGTVQNGTGLLPKPEHFEPPPAVGRITRLKTIGLATYAWDTKGDIWVWGRHDSIPSIDARPLQDCLLQVCAPRKLPLIPNSGKFIDLGNVDNVVLIAMTERYELWTWCLLPDGPGKLCDFPAAGWVRFNFPHRPGYIPNIRALISSRIFIGSYLEAAACYPPSPPFPDPDFLCSGGVWTLFSPSTTISSTITVESPISIRGNLTIGNSTTIEIYTGTGGGVGVGKPSFISLEGCLIMDSDLSLDVDLTQQTLGTPKKGEQYPFGKETITIGLIDLDSNCITPSLDSMHVNFKKPRNGPSCKKYKMGQTRFDDSETGRRTLNMIVVVDSSGCNTWWIAVSAAIGGAILIAIIVALIILRVRKYRSEKKLRMTD